MAGTVRNYTLTYPDTDNTTLTFAGFVGNNPDPRPFDGALTKTAEIVIMGSPMPTWTHERAHGGGGAPRGRREACRRGRRSETA